VGIGKLYEIPNYSEIFGNLILAPVFKNSIKQKISLTEAIPHIEKSP
jgi:hypothetical protein